MQLSTLGRSLTSILLTLAGAVYGTGCEGAEANPSADTSDVANPTNEDADQETSPLTGCAAITASEACVPAGHFWMGCNETLDSQCLTNEVPQHEVWLSTFGIDKLEVTVADYKACVDAGRCDVPSPGNGGTYEHTDRLDHPVTRVTWQQAKTYCEWDGKPQGPQRLCTEAEWEMAARGACELRPDVECKSGMPTYPWGEATATCKYAVMLQGCGENSTAPAGSKLPGASPYGVLDMAGNAAEWVEDWFGTYPSDSTTDPRGPDTGFKRIGRGGTWRSFDDNLRSARREEASPTAITNGARCCRSL